MSENLLKKKECWSKWNVGVGHTLTMQINKRRANTAENAEFEAFALKCGESKNGSTGKTWAVLNVLDQSYREHLGSEYDSRYDN